jgi:Tfp pilus assembly protein PilF
MTTARGRTVRMVVLVLALRFLLLMAGYLGGVELYYRFRLHAAEEATARYDFDAARDHLTACIRIRPRRSELRLRAARIDRRDGRFAEAGQHLNEFLDLVDRERTPAYLLEYALLRAHQGDLSNSEDYLLGLVGDQGPETPRILEALAYGTNHVYRLGESLRFADAVLEREPDNVPMLLLRAHLWEVTGIFNEALNDYRQAVETHPEHDRARLELAQFLLRRRSVEEAAAEFERLMQRPRRLPGVLLGLALCRLSDAKTDQARELLDRAIEENPDDADALFERGKLAHDEGQLADAEQFLRRAVAQVPYSPQVNLSLSRCLSEQGKDEEGGVYRSRLAEIEADLVALEKVKEALAKAPGDPENHRRAGEICMRNGRDEEALRWFMGALQIDPNHKATHQALADYYTHIGRPDLAAEHRAARR